MKSIKQLFLLLLGITIGIAGVLALHYYQLYKKSEQTNSTLLLQNMQKVCKLVTVEGHVSNILDHQDYIGFDLYPFQKKAIVKVDAKVSAGYDLEKLEFQIDEASRLITIKDFPTAEILSIDTDIQYYDVSESIFNSFSEKELTELNSNAKELIRLKAYNSQLMQEAEAKAMEVLDIIRLIAEAAGWQVVYQKEIDLEFGH